MSHAEGDTTVNSAKTGESDAGTGSSGNTPSGTCVICLDAPVEGACIPCGHMAGCMSCLKDIESKKWGCPICRAKINQIIRLYAVWAAETVDQRLTTAMGASRCKFWYME
jgi:hypothetical protein